MEIQPPEPKVKWALSSNDRRWLRSRLIDPEEGITPFPGEDDDEDDNA